MAVERDEFKFPDEAEAETEQKAEANQDVSDGIEVKIENDIPEEDRNRRPLSKRTVEEIDNEELDEYSEKVQKRLSQMKRIYHDERRAKEAAAREKEEALRFAQAQMEENKRLKERLGNGEKAYIQEVTKAATNELATAKDKLRLAYEAGDAEQITNAQELLTEAKLRLREYEKFKPSLQTQNSGVQPNQQATTPQVQPAPASDPKAEAWKQKNTWFGVDEEMTALALGLHEKLVRSGVDPRSDDYYRRVDETMRKRYPEAFEDAEEEKLTQTKQEEKPVRTKQATVVAPVTRSTAPRQVRLTPTQVALAKKLGLSNEQYARELMKLENDNG